MFFEFWAPFWLRDDQESASCIRPWFEFLHLATSVGFSLQESPDLEFQISDWREAIKATKKSSARGVCGWSQPELKSMSDGLLQLLRLIANRSHRVGFPSWMMLAR